MSVKIVTAPTVEPVTLDQVKKFLHEDFTDQDELINMMIQAARQKLDNGLEGWLGRSLLTQTWDFTVDRFPGTPDPLTNSWCQQPSLFPATEIMIPFPPLQEIISINYFDTGGTEQTLSPTEYTVDTSSQPGWVVPKTKWPNTLNAINAVTIQFKSGYGDTPDKVPGPIRTAIMQMVGHMYANRETVVIGSTVAKIPLSAEWLLRDYRVQLGMA